MPVSPMANLIICYFKYTFFWFSLVGKSYNIFWAIARKLAADYQEQQMQGR